MVKKIWKQVIVIKTRTNYGHLQGNFVLSFWLLQQPCLDGNGNLITTDKGIENRAIEVFAKRLEGNAMKEDIIHIEEKNKTMSFVN